MTGSREVRGSGEYVFKTAHERELERQLETLSTTLTKQTEEAAIQRARADRLERELRVLREALSVAETGSEAVLGKFELLVLASARETQAVKTWFKPTNPASLKMLSHWLPISGDLLRRIRVCSNGSNHSLVSLIRKGLRYGEDHGSIHNGPGRAIEPVPDGRRDASVHMPE